MPYGHQKAGVKVHEESKIGASEIRGVRDQVGGSGVKIRASGFRSSKVPGVKGDESPFPPSLSLVDGGAATLKS